MKFYLTIPALLTACLTPFIECLCTFPSDLRGPWISSVKGVVYFNDTMLLDYPVGIPGLPLMDFECQEIEGNKFILRGLQSARVFSQIIKFSLCLDIRKVSEDEFQYFYVTEYHPLALEHIHGSNIVNTPNVTDICNKNQSYDQVEPLTLKRNVSLGQGFSSMECPKDILAVYHKITITDQPENIQCPYSRLDVCRNKTLLTFTNGLTCSKDNVSMSGQGITSCLRHKTIENTIYLNVWTNDTQFKPFSDVGFVCFVIEKTGSNLQMNIYPEYCTDMMTSSSLLELEASSVGEVCSPKKKSTTKKPKAASTTTTPPIKLTNPNPSILPYVLVPIAVVICILIGLAIFVHCMRKNKCLAKPKTTEIGFTNFKSENQNGVAFVNPPDSYQLPAVRKR